MRPGIAQGRGKRLLAIRVNGGMVVKTSLSIRWIRLRNPARLLRLQWIRTARFSPLLSSLIDGHIAVRRGRRVAQPDTGSGPRNNPRGPVQHVSGLLDLLQPDAAQQADALAFLSALESDDMERCLDEADACARAAA